MSYLQTGATAEIYQLETIADTARAATQNSKLAATIRGPVPAPKAPSFFDGLFKDLFSGAKAAAKAGGQAIINKYATPQDSTYASSGPSGGTNYTMPLLIGGAVVVAVLLLRKK